MAGKAPRGGTWDRQRFDRLEARVMELEQETVRDEELTRAVSDLRDEIGTTRRWAVRTAIGVLTLNVTVFGGLVAALLGAL